ncbi:MAG: hypothetical protein QME92_05845 [Bacillota bacterium]|nr:hypothetical protein [Bacillota bacterium]
MAQRDYDDSRLTRDEIDRIAREALSDLYRYDFALLQHDVSERAITHKLAERLQRLFPGFDVDCQYNRNVELGPYAEKVIHTPRDKRKEELRDIPRSEQNEEKLLEVSTYPDIVVHRRLKNDKNMLVIEVKKRSNERDCWFDRLKLGAFTGTAGRDFCNYRYGLLVILRTRSNDVEEPELIWFCNGQEESVKPGGA